MSFYQALQSNPNSVKYDVEFGDAKVTTVNGQSVISTSGIPVNDILIKGSVNPVEDSGLSVTHAFGQAIIKPINNMESLTLNSTNSSVRVKSDTSSVFIDAEQTTGGINLTAYNQQHIAYGNISLSANGSLTLQAGGGAQIQIDSSGNINILSASGRSLQLSSNAGASNWVFDGTSVSGGNLVFPTSAPVGVCTLKVNSIDGLMYWDPVA